MVTDRVVVHLSCFFF